METVNKGGQLGRVLPFWQPNDWYYYLLMLSMLVTSANKIFIHSSSFYTPGTKHRHFTTGGCYSSVFIYLFIYLWWKLYMNYTVGLNTVVPYNEIQTCKHIKEHKNLHKKTYIKTTLWRTQVHDNIIYVTLRKTVWQCNNKLLFCCTE